MKLITAFLLFLFSMQVCAVELFSFGPSDLPPDFSPPSPPNIPGVESQLPVTVNIRALAHKLGSREGFIDVDIGGRQMLRFKERDFQPLNGFVPRGLVAVTPDPKAPDKALWYRWYGVNGNRSMTLSVKNGAISASVIDSKNNYAVLAWPKNGYIRRVDPKKSISDVVFDEHLGKKHGKSMTEWLSENASNLPKSSTIPVVIDVLFLHTPKAIAAAGGQAQLDVKVDEAIHQTNTIVRNSGISNYRYRNALATSQNGGASTLLFNYNEVSGNQCSSNIPPGYCNFLGHRINLRNNINARTLRNQHLADMVSLIVEGAPGEPNGVAYTQRPSCSDYPEYGETNLTCQPGTAFNDFAYSVVRQSHLTVEQVFAHEIGHQMGMEHNKDFITPGTPTYQPYAFGYYQNGVNETVMSSTSVTLNPENYCPSGCPRALQFSNPAVNFLGTSFPSGTQQARNARVGALTAPIIAAFRGGDATVIPGGILTDGFESIPQ